MDGQIGQGKHSWVLFIFSVTLPLQMKKPNKKKKTVSTADFNRFSRVTVERIPIRDSKCQRSILCFCFCCCFLTKRKCVISPNAKFKKIEPELSHVVKQSFILLTKLFHRLSWPENVQKNLLFCADFVLCVCVCIDQARRALVIVQKF